ncbi:MAG: hypothetical protein KF768_13510 [Phycisphaeraceae bacterium]|nr:hypothetical protein [Phycisphaeraceae bacterium]
MVPLTFGHDLMSPFLAVFAAFVTASLCSCEQAPISEADRIASLTRAYASLKGQQLFPSESQNPRRTFGEIYAQLASHQEHTTAILSALEGEPLSHDGLNAELRRVLPDESVSVLLSNLGWMLAHDAQRVTTEKSGSAKAFQRLIAIVRLGALARQGVSGTDASTAAVLIGIHADMAFKAMGSDLTTAQAGILAHALQEYDPRDPFNHRRVLEGEAEALLEGMYLAALEQIESERAKGLLRNPDGSVPTAAELAATVRSTTDRLHRKNLERYMQAFTACFEPDATEADAEALAARAAEGEFGDLTRPAARAIVPRWRAIREGEQVLIRLRLHTQTGPA